MQSCKCFERTVEALEEVIDGTDEAAPERTAEQERLAMEERRARKKEEETAQEARRRHAEAESLLRAEEDARQKAENLRRQAKEAEQAFKEEKARYEHLRRDRELAESMESAQREEVKRLAGERDRKMAVAAFLQEHGFKAITEYKRSVLRKTTPLHRAAKLGDPKMVEMLMKEGANPLQKNTAGRTPLQLAQLKDQLGSHDAVIAVLQRSFGSNMSLEQSAASEARSSTEFDESTIGELPSEARSRLGSMSFDKGSSSVVQSTPNKARSSSGLKEEMAGAPRGTPRHRADSRSGRVGGA